ncbi:MAG: hypothetical protein P8Z79_13420 [Sedimentisphaerales bacterium]|jgi:uncharacterized protein
MKNPFVYQGLALNNSFCNRRQEIEKILSYAQTSNNLLLYSHRRYGKSSLIVNAFKKIKEQGHDINVMHIDLFGTLSEREFCATLYRGLPQLEGSMQRLFNFMKKGARQLKLTLGVDAWMSGGFVLTPTLEASDANIVLDDLMKILSGYSKNKRLVIAFDEFQEIAFYSPGNFEKLLRSYIQRHDRISYIFSGSQQHIISSMFADKSRAFYQLADTMPLSVIGTDAFTQWMNDLFSAGNVFLPAPFLEKSVNSFENHPLYIQKFCHFLWNRIFGKKGLKEEALGQIADDIEQEMLKEKELDFQGLWQQFSLNQKRAIKLVVLTGGKAVFSGKNLLRCGISNSSIAHRALNSLVAKDVICKNHEYKLYDVLFKKWLMKKLIY